MLVWLRRNFLNFLSLLAICLPGATSASASIPARTTYLFNFQKSLDPSVATCNQFFEKVISTFPSPSEEYAIRSTSEASCMDGATTEAYFHIFLVAEDSAAAAELEQYMDATMAVDLWGFPVTYRIVKKLIQTISIDAGVMSYQDGRSQFARTNIEHVVLTHELLGRAIDVFKAFKKDFVRGNVTSLVTLLQTLSPRIVYSEYILPYSNMIEAFLNTVAVIENGDIFAVRFKRWYIRDCGITAGKTCIDEL